MFSDKMLNELNKQINAEFYSAYLYLSMGAFFEAKSLNGFANWMKVQAQEELSHGMKIYTYINERGENVKVSPIDGPKTEWSSPLEAFEDTLGHEKKVTDMINNLVNLAVSESDHATNNFLQWFVAEQVEEESSASEILDQLKLIGNQGDGILMLDRELAGRTFVMPTTKEGE